MVDIQVQTATLHTLLQDGDPVPLLELRFRATVALASVLAVAAAQTRSAPSGPECGDHAGDATGLASTLAEFAGSRGATSPGATKVDAVAYEDDALRDACRPGLHHEWTPVPSAADGSPWFNMSPLTLIQQHSDECRAAASPGASSSLSGSPAVQSALFSVAPSGSFIIRSNSKPAWTPIAREADCDSFNATSPLFRTPGAPSVLPVLPGVTTPANRHTAIFGEDEICPYPAQRGTGEASFTAVGAQSQSSAAFLRKSASAGSDELGSCVAPSVRSACSLSNHPLTFVHGERQLPAASQEADNLAVVQTKLRASQEAERVQKWEVDCKDAASANIDNGWHRMCADFQRPAEKLLAELEEQYRAKMLLRQG